MNKLFIASLMLAFSSAYAGSQESKCVRLSNYAKTVAEAKEVGITEKEVMSITPTKPNPKWDVDREMIVTLIYTMQLAPKEARQLVYIKCSTGAYN